MVLNSFFNMMLFSFISYKFMSDTHAICIGGMIIQSFVKHIIK